MDKIPAELTITVFEYLDYRDLKLTIPLVCKRFHQVLLTSFNSRYGLVRQTLFIDEPDPTFPSRDTVYLHMDRWALDDEATMKTHPTSEFHVHPIFSRMTIDFDRYNRCKDEDEDGDEARNEDDEEEQEEQQSRRNPDLELILVNNRPLDLHMTTVLLEGAITPAVGPHYTTLVDDGASNDSSSTDPPVITPSEPTRKSVTVLDIITEITKLLCSKLKELDDMNENIASRRMPDSLRVTRYKGLSLITQQMRSDYDWNGKLDLHLDENGHVHVVVVWGRMDRTR